MKEPLLLLNFATTFYLLGLILTIQFVHYPGFIYVDRKLFPKFHLFHVRRISLIVMIPMVVELLGSIALAALSPNIFHFILVILVLLIWISTAFLSVPKHNKLAKEKNSLIISQIVLTNWPRTILWTSRAAILTYLIIKV